MKVMYRLLALIMTVFMFTSMNTALGVDDAYPSTYTYNYDYWGDIRESPDAYRVADVIYSGDLELETPMKKPQSLYIRNNDIYVADTGNNRILQIRREGGNFTLVRIIDAIQGCELTTLNAPADVFVDVDENIYIADTNNNRVVMVDKDLNFIKEFVKPSNAVFNAVNPDNSNASVSVFYSDFREGLITLVLPVGTYNVAEDLLSAKTPGYVTTIIGNDVTAQISEGKAVTVSIMNLYTKDGTEVDVSGHTVAAVKSADLTEEELKLIAAKEAEDEKKRKEGDETKVTYGILKINASSVGAEIPSNTVFDQSLSFLPNKIVADVSGRIFVLATNVNKGLIKFETDMTFTGFVGANKVSYNFVEYIWKNYFMTKEQRAQQASFVPTEYHNIYIDEESFIYATNTVFSEYDLLYDVAQPIRRLNGIGSDILIKNDRYPPVGDLYWVEGSVTLGPSKLVDITVLENDIYVAIDQTRGRIFGYDSQGVMLWAFGTSGSSEGAFNSAIAIEHMNRDLFVLDQNSGSITVFTPTEYGTMIYDAVDYYLKGDYDGSALLWEEVLKMNANYNLAFIGIGRSLMRQEDYEEAMEYFKMANDRENYGRAFRFYRKVMVEENIWWIILVLAAVLIIPVVIRTSKKMRMEVEVHERNQVQK